MVWVTWHQAQAFCRWVGARLPTEAEWEKAARGGDGRRYPWGEEFPVCSATNLNGCERGVLAVGRRSAGASPCGAEDLLGNAAEWVVDWSDPLDRRFKHFRGGSFRTYATASTRTWTTPSMATADIGFRCAR